MSHAPYVTHKKMKITYSFSHCLQLETSHNSEQSLTSQTYRICHNFSAIVKLCGFLTSLLSTLLTLTSCRIYIWGHHSHHALIYKLHLMWVFASDYLCDILPVIVPQSLLEHTGHSVTPLYTNTWLRWVYMLCWNKYIVLIMQYYSYNQMTVNKNEHSTAKEKYN